MSRAEAADAFQRLMLTLRTYEELYGPLPPARSTAADGTVLPSWRLMILPEGGGEMQTFFRMDWRKVKSRLRGPVLVFTAPVYALMKEPTGTQRLLTSDWTFTRIMAIVGPDTAFDHAANRAKLSDMPDDVIVLVDVSDADCHWIKPGDVAIDKVASLWRSEQGMRIGGNYDGGFFVGFADGQVWFLDEDMPVEELMSFLTVPGEKGRDREIALSDYVIDKYPAITHDDL